MVVAVGPVGESRGLQPRGPTKVAMGPGAPSKGSPESLCQTREGSMTPRPFIVKGRQRTRLPPDSPEGSHDTVQGIVPGHHLQLTLPVPPKGCGEAVLMRNPLHVGKALQTELSSGSGILGIPLDAHQPTILHRRQHPAGAIAVAGAHGSNGLAAHSRRPALTDPCRITSGPSYLRLHPNRTNLQLRRMGDGVVPSTGENVDRGLAECEGGEDRPPGGSVTRLDLDADAPPWAGDPGETTVGQPPGAHVLGMDFQRFLRQEIVDAGGPTRLGRGCGRIGGAGPS